MPQGWSVTVNAELVKQLTSQMQAKLAKYGTPIAGR
jgi:hypothetical protein